MEIKYDTNGLVPAIIQDATTKNVLMLGYMNEAAYNKTLETNALFSFDFNNEAELGVSYIQEKYDLLDSKKDATRPQYVSANRITFRTEYRFVDIDINYQYLDGMKSEFLGQYFNFLNGNNQGEIFLKNYLLLKNDFCTTEDLLK